MSKNVSKKLSLLPTSNVRTIRDLEELYYGSGLMIIVIMYHAEKDNQDYKRYNQAKDIFRKTLILLPA